MSSLNIVLVLTTFARTLNTAEYGRMPPYAESGSERVVGGRPDRLPFLLLVEVRGAAVCSAALVSARWAVSAAHCVEGAPPGRVTLKAGRLQPQQPQQPHAVAVQWQQERALRRVELFPSRNRLLFDMALLRAGAPFRRSELVAPMPVCRNWAFPLRGELCLAAGWHLRDGGDGSARARGGGGGGAHYYQYLPRYMLVHALDSDNCRRYYGVRFHRSMVCAKAEDGHSLCLGDGGGPLVCRGLLAGVAKGLVGGAPRHVACGGNRTFMAYTAVGRYRRWLRAHVRGIALDWLARAPQAARPLPPLVAVAAAVAVAVGVALAEA